MPSLKNITSIASPQTTTKQVPAIHDEDSDYKEYETFTSTEAIRGGIARKENFTTNVPEVTEEAVTDENIEASYTTLILTEPNQTNENHKDEKSATDSTSIDNQFEKRKTQESIQSTTEHLKIAKGISTTGPDLDDEILQGKSSSTKTVDTTSATTIKSVEETSKLEYF